MIPDSAISPQSSTSSEWQQTFAHSFRQVNDLLKYCEVDQHFPEIHSNHGFSMLVTRHFASLMEKGNPTDPLLLQVLPRTEEAHSPADFVKDAVGDQSSMAVPGLLHKYHQRVLITLTPACAIHCRYCFRRHFPYREAMPDWSPGSDLVGYLQQHHELKEVIVSGGDPLMLDNDQLDRVILQLNRMDHIRTLRIHSRLLTTLPQRFNQQLIQTLNRFNGQCVFVSHINHANEICDKAGHAARLLRESGITLLNQSVLLAGINDQVDDLATLSHRLFDIGILPYYLHQLDKVVGAAHFDLPENQSIALYQQLLKQLPGYLVPRLVKEIAGESSKTPLICD